MELELLKRGEDTPKKGRKGEMTLRILVTGSINGKFEKFTQKLENLIKKSNFNFCVCVGNFYGQETDFDAILKGEKPFPLPIYVLDLHLPTEVKNVMTETGEIAQNLFHLGDVGFMTTADGVRLAWLASTDKVDTLLTMITPQISPMMAVDTTLSHVPGIDLFLSSLIPSHIVNLTSPLTISGKSLPPIPSSDDLNNVVRLIRPRYCFAPCPDPPNVFWERDPYTNDLNSWSTRFIMMAGLGTEKETKDGKWIYAFSLVPLSTIEPSSQQDALIRVKPQNATALPFGKSVKREAPEEVVEKRRKLDEPPEGYICHKCGEKGHWIRSCPQKRQSCKICNKNHKVSECPQRRELKECWFCLSNPQVLTHLIFALGQEAYLTLPRGQLCKDHVLIVPIVHHASMNHLQQSAGASPEACLAIRSEMWKIWDGIEKMQHIRDCKLVGFEVFGGVDVGQASGAEVANIRPQQHLHLQLVPVPNTLTDAQLEEAFRLAAQEAELDVVEQFPANVTDPYIQIFFGDHLERMDDNGESELRMGRKHLILLPPSQWTHTKRGPFNFQLVRKVLSELLGVPERLDWKKCVTEREVEDAEAQDFKKRFDDGGWSNFLLE